MGCSVCPFVALYYLLTRKMSKVTEWISRKYIGIRAGRSPTFWDPGTSLVGLAGNRVPGSSIEEVLSFKTIRAGGLLAALGSPWRGPVMWTHTC